MRASLAFWAKSYTRKEIMSNAKWLLFLISGSSFEIALLRYLGGNADVLFYLVAGVAALLAATYPFFWVQFLLMLAWTASLIYDYSLRHNPFSFFFIFIGIFHVYYFLRSLKNSGAASS